MRQLLIPCLLIGLLAPISAQDGKPAKDPEKGLSVRLLAEVAPPELGKVYLAFAEEAKSVELVLPTTELSPAIITPQREMILKTAAKNIALCPIVLPQEGKSFAVILVTAKPAGFKPIVVRTDDPTFKVGDVMFLNRSDKVVLGKLGGTPLVMRPGEVTKSRPTDPKENTYYDIAFAVREPTGDLLISTTRWPIDDTLRSYVFFFTNAEGRTTFRAVDEFIVPATASQP